MRDITSRDRYNGIAKLFSARDKEVRELLLFLGPFCRDLEVCLATSRQLQVETCWCTDETDPKFWPKHMSMWALSHCDKICQLRLLAGVRPKELDRVKQSAGDDYHEYLMGHRTVFSHSLKAGPVTHDALMYLPQRNFDCLQQMLPYVLRLPVGPDNTLIGTGLQERFLQQQFMGS